ncbi:MAG: NapC/NirT family cytochrome c [Ignavibacteria bacterium]
MLNKFIQYTSPPKKWKVPVILISGILTGVIILVLYVGNATSYLSDDPETCINCHVMYPQYANGEQVPIHKKVSCNDCHVPQDNVFRKYYFKASDGLRHSAMFTLDWARSNQY